ncbi:hypothetical protein HPB50_010713 [Hyalomma asiaticum]|uniref:Uncharacterized protein n=1 Tax=Hyalomma asiaticum TaxID=266040 RepID=A0ACB7SIH6_HYAAI|nr:hypothetical protein HPB50_010713 [Hyalomma asiaticum]
MGAASDALNESIDRGDRRSAAEEIPRIANGEKRDPKKMRPRNRPRRSSQYASSLFPGGEQDEADRDCRVRVSQTRRTRSCAVSKRNETWQNPSTTHSCPQYGLNPASRPLASMTSVLFGVVVHETAG